MNKQTLKHFAVWSALLGLLLSASLSGAQVGLASKLPGKRPPSVAAQVTSPQTKTAGSPSYTYTLLSYPGSLGTYAEGMNLEATTNKMEIAGGTATVGFLARVSGTKTITETYQVVYDPHFPANQGPTDINDSGQIVGTYVDNSGAFHGYERSGTKFTTLDVPFSGATGTFPSGINDSGEVVGAWGNQSGDLDLLNHGFTLIGGTYTSVDYPGGIWTNLNAVNSTGDIAGAYFDASGVEHGFLLSGGTYTSFDPPGSIATVAYGINDADDIVGTYWTGEGAQGFLLSGGVFTMIVIPGEPYTSANGINNNGVIVGNYTDAAGLVVSFLATP